MLIFMLVLMVIPLTRKRFQAQDSGQLRIQSAVDESSSETVQQSTSKRNRRLPNVESTDAAVARVLQPANQNADANQPSVNPRKRRGPSLNLKATKVMETLPEGEKLSLTMDTRTKQFVGTSSTLFATECGIVMRNICPMNFHKWESIPTDVKDQMYEKLEGGFKLLRSDRVFMEYVNHKLRYQWKRTRCQLSAHWKKNKGETNPKLARSKMSSSCRSPADWNHLCDYWELESTRNYSAKMKINRGKQVVASRGGSRSIANHIFHMTNHETQVQPSPFEVYRKLHYDVKKQDWQNDDARIQYDNIVRHKEEAVAKLVSEGITISTNMHHNLENEAIDSVCTKEKTKKSAWKVGVGPVQRKKDSWMTSEAESSRSTSNENETLQNKVASLEEKLRKVEQINERNEKVIMYMSSKFPDFDSVTSAHMSSGETGTNEQLNDDDRSSESLL